MDLKKIKRLLKDFPSAEVGIYCEHIETVEKATKSDGTYANPWFRLVTEEDLALIYKRVSTGGVFIDGKSVSLAWKSKRLTVNYDYQAYKNRLLFKYPESVFDHQLVYKSDSFIFHKRDGAVSYSHDIVNPFDTEREIVGAYFIIKNSRGQFIETIHMKDIEKMRAHSNFKNTWEEWFDRMVLKSVIKRACKSHFDDHTKDLDAIDNLEYDLNNEVPEKDVFDKIKEFDSEQKLFAWAASQENAKFTNNDDFRAAVKEKALALRQDKVEPQTKGNE